MDRSSSHAPRVLHASALLSPGLAAMLAVATHELVRSGVRQTVLHVGPEGGTPPELAAMFDPQVRLVALDPPESGGHWAHVRALRAALQVELASRRHDVVHLHGVRAGLAGRLALSALAEPPSAFYSPHGLGSLDARRPLAGKLAGWAERAVAFAGSHPVAGGLAEAREIERLTGRVASVLEQAIDAAFFDVMHRPEKPPRVLAVGRIVPRRQPELFAELAARFQYAGAQVRFVWAGEGDADLSQALRASGVELTGWLTPDALREELARADVLVQTASCEGMPLAVAQAMAAGVPCVLSDVPGHRDLVVHELTGLLAPDVSGLALQVRALLDDPALARRIGEAARRDAWLRFHPQRFGDALLALYRLRPALARQEAAAGVFDAAVP
jgi:glycosyltransferase involved in cell wall biosynthesis